MIARRGTGLNLALRLCRPQNHFMPATLGKLGGRTSHLFQRRPRPLSSKSSELTPKKAGANTVIHRSAVVSNDVVLGEDCVIGANAVIQNAVLGDRVVVHPGACIGQDGFGFHIGEENQGHAKKPQSLLVIIGSDVEIGANCTIDRGSWRHTEIGQGTKIDNLVQVGHNVKIGSHCLVAAQTGIAGSTVIGDRCLIGGQVGIAQHLSIGSGVQIAAKSGVMSDLEAHKKYGR